MQLILSILIIIFTRLAIIYIVMLIEPFKIARLPLIGLALVWGIASFVAADVLQSTFIIVPYQGPNTVAVVALLSAPVLEEALMFIFPLWLYHFTLARYSGDGMVYGFALGSGFAAAESLAYVLANPDQALSTAIARVISVGLVHASIEGVVVAGVCGVIYYRRWKAYPIFVLLFLFAVIAHHLFNLFALVHTVYPDMVAMAVSGMIGLGVIIALERYHKWEERRGIRRNVGGGLNSVEITLVQHGDDVFRTLDGSGTELGEAETNRLNEYLITEQQIALLMRRAIHEKSLRPRIHLLREELEELKAKSSALKQQLSPAALEWLARQDAKTGAT